MANPIADPIPSGLPIATTGASSGVIYQHAPPSAAPGSTSSPTMGGGGINTIALPIKVIGGLVHPMKVPAAASQNLTPPPSTQQPAANPINCSCTCG